MHPARALGGGHPLHAVDAALKLEASVHALPCNARAGQLEAPCVAACLLQHLCHTAATCDLAYHQLSCYALPFTEGIADCIRRMDSFRAQSKEVFSEWVRVSVAALTTLERSWDVHPQSQKAACAQSWNSQPGPFWQQLTYAYLKLPALLFGEALIHVEEV